MTTGPTTYDGRGDRPTVAVVDAVAEAEGCDPVALDPLYSVIDPDAMDDLFDGESRNAGVLQFQYHGYTIVVDWNDRVSITDENVV